MTCQRFSVNLTEPPTKSKGRPDHESSLSYMKLWWFTEANHRVCLFFLMDFPLLKSVSTTLRKSPGNVNHHSVQLCIQLTDFRGDFFPPSVAPSTFTNYPVLRAGAGELKCPTRQENVRSPVKMKGCLMSVWVGGGCLFKVKLMPCHCVLMPAAWK